MMTGDNTCFHITGPYVVKCVHGAMRKLSYNFLYDCCDIEETYLTGQKTLDCDLVRCIQYSWCAAAILQNLACQAKRGKPFRVRRLESQLSHSNQIKPLLWRLQDDLL